MGKWIVKTLNIDVIVVCGRSCFHISRASSYVFCCFVVNRIPQQPMIVNRAMRTDCDVSAAWTNKNFEIWETNTLHAHNTKKPENSLCSVLVARCSTKTVFSKLKSNICIVFPERRSINPWTNGRAQHTRKVQDAVCSMDGRRVQIFI